MRYYALHNQPQRITSMNLDTILLDLSNPKSKDKDYWTLRDAVRGTQIFGGIGSGKTSGSGRMLASSFLKNGFGGLVLCAKPKEREDWVKLAKQFGRQDDIKIICEPKLGEKEYFFNPLEYEASRSGGGETFNLVNLFMQIYQMGRLISGEGLASGSERFWDNALKRCLSRIIDFLKLAGESVTISNMYRLISESLSNKEIEYLIELRNSDDSEDAYDKISEWAKFNYYVKCFFESKKNLSKVIGNSSNDKELIEREKKKHRMVRNYFEREFANLAERTKTIVVESFLGLVEPFQSGILEKYFAGKTNILPEETFQQGKIIILDFPVKDYLDSGIYAQGIFKLLWQQAVERRVYKENVDIPVFLWVDESQLFLSSYDQVYQTTARSAGACTVFLSQNISNYYSAIGGKNPTAKVNSLLGNLSTKIFHANSDPVTNEWASKSIGKDYRLGRSFSIGDSNSYGGSEQFQNLINPIDFTKLKTGGSINNNQVEGIMIVAGKVWSDENNYLLLSLSQNAI